MKGSFIFFITLFFATRLFPQTASDYNFQFEEIKSGLPAKWMTFGETMYFKLYADSVQKHNGRYSAVIEYSEGEGHFSAWSYNLPDNYAGKKITLSGYIKTENVSEGYAGLWMRIDPRIAFDNMGDRGIKGTTDWTKYEITLEMNPEATTKIVIGALLTGKGKMWIDDFSVSIDGKDITELNPFVSKFPADNDHEFDTGSKIDLDSVNNIQIDNLYHLGLIWGFLKYYHPNIAKGEFNWDYELFRVLPSVLNSQSKKEFDSVLVSWINKLGKFEQGKPLKTDSVKAKLVPDLDWISQSGFSDELTALLSNIKNAKRSNKNYYVGTYGNLGNAEIKHERDYTEMRYPDAGFRILTLFRYWNIIQYYFPYKNLIEEDWKNVLKEFLPLIVKTKDIKDYTLTVLKLIARVHDTHANIWGNNAVLKKYWGDKFAPVEIKFIENKAVVTRVYDIPGDSASGLQVGDIITKIHQRDINLLIGKRLPLTPASNYQTQLREIAQDILRTRDSTLQIEFKRNDLVKELAMRMYPIQKFKSFNEEAKDTCFKILKNDIAYLDNGTLQRSYLPAIWEKMKNTKGLIIDIRNYPSDFIIYDLSNYLVPHTTPFTKITVASVESPGLFEFGETAYVGKKNKDYYKGKVVIIVNEITQSSAEFHAMGYRVNPNAIVIGSTTAGADGNVSQFMLPGGISTMISGIGIYYPDGKETQRVGIVPDIEVKPTIEGIKRGGDELLERALELIESK